MKELEHGRGGAAMFDNLETLLDPSNFEINSKVRRNKLRAIFRKVNSHPARIKAAVTLINGQDKLIRIKRNACVLDKPDASQKGMGQVFEDLGKINSCAQS